MKIALTHEVREETQVAIPNAQQFWTNWSNGMNNSLDRMRAGVNAVQEAPGTRAVAAMAKMRANWLRALDEGKWTRGVTAVTVQQWQQAMINKGIPRIADGVRGAQNKVTNFAQQLLAFETALQGRVRQMPNVTVADRRARMNAWFDGMQTFRRNQAPSP